VRLLPRLPSAALYHRSQFHAQHPCREPGAVQGFVKSKVSKKLPARLRRSLVLTWEKSRVHIVFVVLSFRSQRGYLCHHRFACLRRTSKSSNREGKALSLALLLACLHRTTTTITIVTTIRRRSIHKHTFIPRDATNHLSSRLPSSPFASHHHRQASHEPQPAATGTLWTTRRRVWCCGRNQRKRRRPTATSPFLWRRRRRRNVTAAAAAAATTSVHLSCFWWWWEWVYSASVSINVSVGRQWRRRSRRGCFWYTSRRRQQCSSSIHPCLWPV